MASVAEGYACVCGGSSQTPSAEQRRGELKRELDAALAVFVGEPIAMNILTVRFRVESLWKGALGREVIMSSGTEATPDGGLRASSCNFTFSLGQTYLVFAHGQTTETMKAHACSFTGVVRGLELQELLDDVAPRQAPSPGVPVKLLVGVIGTVRRPGLIEWRDGLTVEEALALAGGAIPPVRPEYTRSRLTSTIIRHHADASREEQPATLTALLLPGDELFVRGDLVRKHP